MGVTLWNRIPQIIDGMEAKASAAVEKAVFDIEAKAKTHAPVDTGYLKSSIQGQMTGKLSGLVNAGASYAIYQEYGTYKMAAQPFMVPAAEEVRPAFIAAMRQVAQ